MKLLSLILSVSLAVYGPPRPEPTLDDLREELVEILDSFPGQKSLFYKDLETGDTISIDPQAMYPCSVVKLPCMMAFYEQGKDAAKHRTELKAMIINSDNTAFNHLADIKAIARILKESGCTDSGIYHGLLPGADYFPGNKDNVMSPRDMGRLLETVYYDDTKEGREMVSLLVQNADKSALMTGLETGTLAHKSGWADGYYHDGGILYLPDADCILVLFTNNSNKKVFTEVSEAVESYQILKYGVAEEETELVEETPDKEEVELVEEESALQSELILDTIDRTAEKIKLEPKK